MKYVELRVGVVLVVGGDVFSFSASVDFGRCLRTSVSFLCEEAVQVVFVVSRTFFELIFVNDVSEVFAAVSEDLVFSFVLFVTCFAVVVVVKFKCVGNSSVEVSGDAFRFVLEDHSVSGSLDVLYGSPFVCKYGFAEWADVTTHVCVAFVGGGVFLSMSGGVSVRSV